MKLSTVCNSIAVLACSTLGLKSLADQLYNYEKVLVNDRCGNSTLGSQVEIKTIIANEENLKNWIFSKITLIR